jgi:ribA/ribD-fused uncharacterized protein
MTYKVIETASHIFFLSGPLSNWYASVFHGKLSSDGPLLRFSKGEQYLMAAKAQLFGDQARLRAIMETNDAAQHKALGRAVCDFTEDQWNEQAAPIWNKEARGIMFRGCWYKQVANEEYREVLLASDDKKFVEGNAKDVVWAVGLAWDDPAILDPNNWRGTNWLGETHDEVRHYVRLWLAMRENNPGLTVSFDPWTKQLSVS